MEPSSRTSNTQTSLQCLGFFCDGQEGELRPLPPKPLGLSKNCDLVTTMPSIAASQLCPSDGALLFGGRQEGELRPQLLDRFGMSVIVYTMPNIASRTRMVLDRLAFEQARSQCPHANRFYRRLLPCTLVTVSALRLKLISFCHASTDVSNITA